MVYAQIATITGLGPEGGIITLLKGRPDDAVVFAVVNETHLYRSLDGGSWWEKVYLPEPNSPGNDGNNQFNKWVSIKDIAFHPESDTILIATSMGFYRSTDRGDSWAQVNTFPSPRVCVKYVPSNPTIIFGSDEQGVLVSTNGGDTWEPRKDNFIGNRYIRSIAIHPADVNLQSMRLLATTDFYDTTGIFYTSNGGATWIRYSEGIPSGALRRIYGVEMDATGLGISNFRAVVGTSNGMYVLQTDFGTRWSAVPKISGVITCGTFILDTVNGVPGYNCYIASNGAEYDGKPGSYSIVNGLIQVDSREGSLLNPNLIPRRIFKELSDINSIFIPFKKNSKKIYLGTSAGIFVSEDGGANWLPKNKNIFHAAIRNLASISSASGSMLFAGVYGGGVYRLTDDGTTWIPSNTGLTNPYVTTLQTDGKRLYAGTALTVYYSDNEGQTWNSVPLSNFTILGDSNLYKSRYVDMTIRVSLKNPAFVMMHSRVYGLNLSTDGGQTWSLKQIPSPYDTIYIPENIEFDPVDSQTIYFSGSGLLKSTNLGENWIDITSSIPRVMYVSALGRNVPIYTLSPTINPKNNREIFLASVYDMNEATPLGLWKTTNGGDTSWTMINPPLAVYDVVHDKFDIKRLIASGPGGIFRTTDGGTTWDSLHNEPFSAVRYFLVSQHASNSNFFYVGSEQGAFKIEMNEKSLLTIDSLEYIFDSVTVGDESIKTVTLRNINGKRSAVIRYNRVVPDESFKYLGEEEFEVPAGGEASFNIKFSPQTGGVKTAVMRFITSDENFDTLRIVIRGYGHPRNVIGKFTFDFGSVAVGEDSSMQLTIDNTTGIDTIKLNYIGNSDTNSFSFTGNRDIVVEPGRMDTTATLCFAPKSTGTKQAYIKFATSDLKFPTITLRLQGTGIARSFIKRRILLDTSVYTQTNDGSPLNQYFKLFALSLERTGIKVDFQKVLPASEYNAMVYVAPDGPPPAEVVDSLVPYILNGGTVVALGDYGSRNELSFNTFLNDSVWGKYNVKTGIRFNSDTIFNESIQDSLLLGMSIAYPSARNPLTYKVDSVVLFYSGSISVDTTVLNAGSLLIAKTPQSISASTTPFDTFAVASNEKIVAAYSLLGKGKIIAIADYDIWWNGLPDDTTKTLGIFGANNLRLALNIFGLVDNLSARLPTPTPQEAYKLISIPYSFADSSARALFKDLGEPNKYVWRMFGKWRDSVGYKEFPHDFLAIRRGEAYWLITKEPKEINFGTTSAHGSESDFEITLHPGYNMIGNPFPYRISWAESFREDSVEKVLWYYKKGFDTTSLYMEPFEGYFLKNRGTTSKIIRLSSAQVSDSVSTSLGKEGEAQVHYEPMEWKLQLNAYAPHATDERNFLGMLNKAANGFDEYDFSEPPVAPSNYISLSLKTGKEKLAADFRALSNEGQYWDVDIVSSKPKVPVSLTLRKFGNMPNNFKMYILDKIDERVTDVTTSLSYTFTLGKKEYTRQLRMIIGTESFVENNTGGIPLTPIEYTLEQNYPNPFNPTTTIKYTLSHSAQVKLEIFNILGQRVKTLINQFQPIGVYSTQWDGTDDQKKKVASGFYYYRLQANEFTSVKKMTLIK